MRTVEAMTDGELRDELVSLLLAGHETTATATAWAIERLVRHPRRAGAPPGGDRRAAMADEYMQAVINETLRCRPVVPVVVRLLQEPLVVGGHELPAGTRVVPSIYLTNRNPRVYARPARVPPRALSRRGARTRSPGSRSAAASAAASGRRSRCSRCG